MICDGQKETLLYYAEAKPTGGSSSTSVSK